MLLISLSVEQHTDTFNYVLRTHRYPVRPLHCHQAENLEVRSAVSPAPGNAHAPNSTTTTPPTTTPPMRRTTSRLPAGSAPITAHAPGSEVALRPAFGFLVRRSRPVPLVPMLVAPDASRAQQVALVWSELPAPSRTQPRQLREETDIATPLTAQHAG